MINILGTINPATLYILIKSAIYGHILMQRFPNHGARDVKRCSVKKSPGKKKKKIFIKPECGKHGQSLKHRSHSIFRKNLPSGY